MSDAPKRIQRKRTKGAHLPPNTVCCTRPGPLGNPFLISTCGRAAAVALHRKWLRAENAAAVGIIGSEGERLDAMRAEVLRLLPGLRGKNIACWCAEPAKGAPDLCHGATLLEMANAEPRRG